MIRNIILFLIWQLFYSYGQKVIWDRNADLRYPEYDDLARDNEIHFPNWVFIYPGTKWCGAGNIADDYDDLGDEAFTDKCCRKHDHCPDIIEAHQTKYNLTNPSFYSRLHCDCDYKFLKCLKSVNSKSSTKVGTIYFTGLNTQCFKEEHPIIGCRKRTYFPYIKCVDYKLDATKDKIYQWFDVPNY